MTPPRNQRPTRLSETDRDAIRTALRTLRLDDPGDDARAAATAALTDLADRAGADDAHPKAAPDPDGPNPRFELRITGLLAAGVDDAVDLVQQRAEPQPEWEFQLRRIDTDAEGTERTQLIETTTEHLDDAAQDIVQGVRHPQARGDNR